MGSADDALAVPIQTGVVNGLQPQHLQLTFFGSGPPCVHGPSGTVPRTPLVADLNIFPYPVWIWRLKYPEGLGRECCDVFKNILVHLPGTDVIDPQRLQKG